MKKEIFPLNNNKVVKRGFTLVELIAVMAIVAILSAVSIPKIAGYIEEAKKTKALVGAREVVMAAQTYNFNKAEQIKEDDTYKTFKNKIIDSNYLKLDKDNDDNYIDNVDDTLTYGELQKIVEGKQDFKVENDKVCMP
ncbi:type II secretion system protein [Clostridium sp. HCP1S3_B4]|mgnify:CR=1 FL=1|uniref:type II secretion system protein n=1 Tax=unclassified Clostridium TaxID=2614128 RepID=UPI0016B892BD|nr:type II secretion system protein [Clostridiales bacterium]MDY2729516.1 type II secretion system protein [Clostridium sp.]NLK24553.1 type II secretion system protein [Clostridiales bacterium]